MMWFYLNGRGRTLDSFMNREDNSRINSFRVGINLTFMIIFFNCLHWRSTHSSHVRDRQRSKYSLSVHNFDAISKLVFIIAITCLKTCNRSLEVFIFNITSRNTSPTSCKDYAGLEDSCHPYVLVITYTNTPKISLLPILVLVPIGNGSRFVQIEYGRLNADHVLNVSFPQK